MRRARNEPISLKRKDQETRKKEKILDHNIRKSTDLKVKKGQKDVEREPRASHCKSEKKIRLKKNSPSNSTIESILLPLR